MGAYRMKEQKRTIRLVVIGLASFVSSCALITPQEEKIQPIENPFGDFYSATKALRQPVILRTKKGDRSIEVELPETNREITDFVVPMSPEFKNMDSARNPASAGTSNYDYGYDERKPTIADREIEQTFPRGKPEDEWKRQEIEKNLGLAATEESASESDTSYLAQMDKIKQLYNMGRFEAALLEIDPMIRVYPTNPKLYEMRGTILDKLGYLDLALRSWNQALEFSPSNESLRKYIDRKKSVQSRRLASP